MAEKEYIERKEDAALLSSLATKADRILEEKVFGAIIAGEDEQVVSAAINSLWKLAREPVANVRPVVHDTTHIQDVLDLVVAERRCQIEKWGARNDNQLFEWMSILGEEFGELCESVNESLFKHPTHPERGGCENIIREAVQVATVAVAIAESQMHVANMWERLKNEGREMEDKNESRSNV